MTGSTRTGSTPAGSTPGAPFGSSVAVVAGGGGLPKYVVRGAAAAGLRVGVVALKGEADPDVGEGAHSCRWVAVGKLRSLIRAVLATGARDVTFAGGVSRARLFRGAWPDALALKVIARAGSVRDDVILRAVAAEFESAGLSVFGCDRLLGDLVPRAGVLTARGLDAREEKDARLGRTVAEAFGALDVGQAVVVKDGVVVAVEAVEGTDAAVARAGALAGPGCVVVKMCKPQQDVRLDLPTAGPATVDALAAAGATALVVHAGRSLLLDPGATVAAADRAGIAVAAWE